MKKSKKQKAEQINRVNTNVTASTWNSESFLMVIIVAGVLYHWVAINYAIVTGTESENWSSAQGNVEDVQIIEHSESRTNSRGGSSTTNKYYEALVAYRYTISGKLYTNNMVTAGGGWFFGTHDEAKRKTDSVRSLSAVKVFYDPSDPSKSVLERGVPERTSSGMLITVPLIGVAFGLAFNNFFKKKIPDENRRRGMSILIGIGVAVVAGILQWLVLVLVI